MPKIKVFVILNKAAFRFNIHLIIKYGGKIFDVAIEIYGQILVHFSKSNESSGLPPLNPINPVREMEILV